MKYSDFLYCTPTVFVIGDEYEILINLKKHGLCFVKIGDEIFYEENSGVLPSERTIVKIRAPQERLNMAKEYEIIFRATDERKAYWSTFLPPETVKYSFKPLDKTENIRIYYISDVHYCFDIARKTASYFGDEVDLYVVNGDIGEVETEEHFLEVCGFVGDVAFGKIPVLFSRGNHDTRGRLAERFVDYFPCQGKKTYYTFEIGCLGGVVLDCGEDKNDTSDEYDFSKSTPEEYLGINRFHDYRKKQLEFLRSVERRDDRITFAVTHICPAMTTDKIGGIFDIDREIYGLWCDELERIRPAFMLCGHYHTAFKVLPGDERSLIHHSYPIVMGINRIPNVSPEHFWGTAIILNKHKAEVMFTDESHMIREQFVLEF